MNSKQINRLQKLTTRLAQLRNDMSFSVMVLDDIDGRPVMISASNTGAPWYEPYEFFLAFIGPQGGLKVREGSSFIRNMI